MQMRNLYGTATLWASFVAFLVAATIQGALASSEDGQQVFVFLAGAVGLKYYFYAIALPTQLVGDSDYDKPMTAGAWFILIFQASCIVASHVSVACASLGQVALPFVIILATLILGIVYVLVVKGSTESIGNDQLVIDVLAFGFVLIALLRKLELVGEADAVNSNESVMMMIGFGYAITTGIFAISLFSRNGKS